MKKYRMLEIGEKAMAGDEIKGLGDRWLTMHEALTGEDGYVVNSLSAPVRRPIPYEGKVAFLVNYSPTIRVEIDTTGLTDEQIDQKLIEAAQAKHCYEHQQYMNDFHENIDWENTKEDTECLFVVDEPKIYGQGCRRYVFDITETYSFADFSDRPDEEHHTEVIVDADNLDEANEIASEISPFNIVGELIDCQTEFNREIPTTNF